MNARSLALCLALLACPAAGLAQFSAFLWLPGAPGETQDTNHVGWMDLSSAGVANLFNSNPSAIEATFQRGLAFAKNVDSASAVLSLQCGRGTPFASGILDITASTNTAVPILRLQLTNVFVNLVSHNFSSGGATITEQISLQSQIQTWSYNQIDFTTGLPINDVSSSWDFVSQAPTVTGPTWSAIHASTIDLFADCTAQGGSTVTKMGFSYSPTAVNPTPTLGGTGVSEWDFGNPGVTGMSGVINSLTPSTEYSVVSFAVNSYGVGYSTVTNFTTGPGPSGSLVVTTLQDVSGVAGVNSLRDAVNYAYELNDTATVTFAPSLFTNGPGTLVLSGSANPVSIENLGGILTIHGPSSGLLTISGNNQTEIFYLSAASVVLDGMTVANSSGSASAIRAGGSALLTVSNMVFVENYSSENGGAVNSQGSLGLWVYDCTFATNTTAGEGGAIFAGSGVYTVNVVDSAFAGNVSGLNEDGTTNRNAGAGGAIYTATAYGLYLVNSTFVGNQVENGPGGAIYVGNADDATEFEIADCTLTGNAAAGAGGGVEYVPGTGGGAHPLALDNSIISGNAAATNADVDMNTNNLTRGMQGEQVLFTNNCLIGVNVTNIFGANTLANNGGLTQTIALNPSGPAINAGSNALISAGITTDQAGQPRINDGTVDIGAYEYQFAAPVIISASSDTFLTGLSNHFSIIATGVPPPVVTISGKPDGVSFQSGVLSGAPPIGSGASSYSMTITAANGVAPDATQDFNLLVVERDVFAAYPGFNTNGLGWALNGDSVNGGPEVTDNVFTPTDGSGGEDRSAWFRYPLYVGGFQASFTYQDVGGNGADGTAFVLQNSAAGPTALGGGGGEMGYVGITPSVAVLLNIYGGSSGGVGWLLGTNGVGIYNLSGQVSGRSYAASGPVNLAGGNPIAVNLRYARNQLSLSLADAVTGATFQTNITVDIPALIGTNAAYVGFTGSEGGYTSHQTVSHFSYAPLPRVAVNTQEANVILGWPGSVYGFLLQSCQDLSKNNWTFFASTPVPTNGLNQITIPIGSGSAFYRLVLPLP